MHCYMQAVNVKLSRWHELNRRVLSEGVCLSLFRQSDNPVPSSGNVISLLERTKDYHSVFGN